MEKKVLDQMVTIAKFLFWLKSLGVTITIAPYIDREPNQVYKTEADMLDLAKRWAEQQK